MKRRKLSGRKRCDRFIWIYYIEVMPRRQKSPRREILFSRLFILPFCRSANLISASAGGEERRTADDHAAHTDECAFPDHFIHGGSLKPFVGPAVSFTKRNAFLLSTAGCFFVWWNMDFRKTKQKTWQLPAFVEVIDTSLSLRNLAFRFSSGTE